MRVDLIAWTKFDGCVAETLTDGWFAEMSYSDSDDLAEFAGRACYKSWDKPNPKTRTNEAYLANIISQHHESVLAHASASFFVQGVSRALTHELVRHRFLVFSQESQRYVDMSESKPVIPEIFQDDEYAIRGIVKHHNESRLMYMMLMNRATVMGHDRKTARDAARYVMPEGTATSLVVSGNLRAWRDFTKQRWTPQAAEEIRWFSGLVLEQLKEAAPNTFQDFE